MTQIAQGAHAYLTMAPGQVYRVQADDVATVQVLYGAPSAVVTLTAESRSFGPYDSDARIKVTANTAAAEYTLLRAHYAELTQAQLDGGAVGALASNNAGGVIEPDGDVPTLGGSVTLPAMQAGFDAGTAPQKAAFQSSVSGADVAPIFAGDVVQATYSISVRSGPGWLTEVYCASGSAVLLSVYDNNATGTGRVAFTDTFSAGKRVTGRWPLVNGAVALFDTGVFEFVFAGE